MIYDVSHNVAKMEEHLINGRPTQLCVHRKGATRAFPAHHPLIPVDYQLTGIVIMFRWKCECFRAACTYWRKHGYM